MDDEPDLTELISFEIQRLGFSTLEAHSGSSAYTLLQETPAIEMIISDVRMPNGDGVEFLERAKSLRPQVPFVLMSGYADISEAHAQKLGAEVLLHKPMDLADISGLVKKVLQFDPPL